MKTSLLTSFGPSNENNSNLLAFHCSIKPTNSSLVGFDILIHTDNHIDQQQSLYFLNSQENSHYLRRATTNPTSSPSETPTFLATREGRGY